MSVANPIKGVNSIVKFTPSGGSEYTLKNSKWSINPKSMIGEAPNTTDGMVRAPGIKDYDGDVEGFFDTTQPIEQNITEGTIGTLKMYRDSTHYWAGTVIIQGFTEDTGVDDFDKWKFSYAKQSGSLTPPAFP
jgi:hypothetical protein